MKGILFKPEMVEKILKGEKTQTRRQITKVTDKWVYAAKVQDAKGKEIKALFGKPDGTPCFYPLPYTKGETIYIKEAYAYAPITNRNEAEDGFAGLSDYIYKFSQNRKKFEQYAPELLETWQKTIKWESPLFMPASAARYFLQITNVKVERLFGITEQDAIKEGFDNKNEFLKYFIELKKRTETNPYVWVISFRLQKDKDKQ
jgi:hypothetical protein